jgi:PAS domain S-box-containing protein
LATTEAIERLAQAGEIDLPGTMARDWIGVPLRTRNAVLGALAVQAYRTDDRRYDEHDKELLSFVSTQIAMAIERAGAEEAMRESEERYRGLFENAQDIVYTCDLAGWMTSLNRAGEQLLGYSREEALTMTWGQLVGSDAQRGRESAYPLTWEGGTRREELQVRTRDGRELHIENSAWLTYRDGRPVGVQGIARDIGERVRLEDQLRQSQKMEAVGRLAGGVAHDFNNLLTVINGYSEFALGSLDPASAPYQDIKSVRQAGEQAASLTRQLLAFSRRQIVEMGVLDLNRELESMRKMLERLIGEDVSLRLELAPEVGNIVADRGHIGQVLANLVVNARDAMPNGGILTIRTADIDLDAHAISRRGQPSGATPGRYAVLSVEDVGVGMSPEVKAHLFEPFFTTKEEGKGTGLGLSTVYGIVSQIGGSIEVESAPGKGTTFNIYLPHAEGPVNGGGAKRHKNIPRGRGEAILVVEDEESVRHLAVRILERLGYVVLVAESGTKALEMCRTRTQPLDLVLTDVIMPGVSGQELVEELAKWRDDFRVLFMSGYTGDVVADRGGLDPGIQLVQKPFTRKSLAVQVRRALDGGGETDVP